MQRDETVVKINTVELEVRRGHCVRECVWLCVRFCCGGSKWMHSCVLAKPLIADAAFERQHTHLQRKHQKHCNMSSKLHNCQMFLVWPRCHLSACCRRYRCALAEQPQQHCSYTFIIKKDQTCNLCWTKPDGHMFCATCVPCKHMTWGRFWTRMKTVSSHCSLFKRDFQCREILSISQCVCQELDAHCVLYARVDT